MVSSKAEDLGVFYILDEGATAFADLLAEQCVCLVEIQNDQKSATDLPLFAALVNDLLESGSGGEVDVHQIRDLIP